jgi:hypothetical protein
LQEAAAARHIRVLCGSKDLDGFAFCTGLQKLSTQAQELNLHPVTHLVKRATFRSIHATDNAGRASLNIFQLGQLLDLYHEYQASKRHDKIYALIGMCSDNLEFAGLSPDYDVPWHDLLARVIWHLLGNHVRIDTWPDREAAMIRGQGFIIGPIMSIEDGIHDAEGYYDITFHDTAHESHRMTTLIPAKPIRRKDIIVRFQGAPSAMVVRPCQDYFTIIAVDVSLPMSVELEKSLDLFVLWNWEADMRDSGMCLESSSIQEVIGEHNPEYDLARSQLKSVRQWGIFEALLGVRQYRELTERIEIIMKEPDTLTTLDHSHLLKFYEMVLICYFRVGKWDKLHTFIQQTIRTGNLGEEEILWSTLQQLKPLNRCSSTERHNWEIVIQVLEYNHIGPELHALRHIVLESDKKYHVAVFESDGKLSASYREDAVGSGL